MVTLKVIKDFSCDQQLKLQMGSDATTAQSVIFSPCVACLSVCLSVCLGAFSRKSLPPLARGRAESDSWQTDAYKYNPCGHSLPSLSLDLRNCLAFNACLLIRLHTPKSFYYEVRKDVNLASKAQHGLLYLLAFEMKHMKTPLAPLNITVIILIMHDFNTYRDRLKGGP